jgi:hypothetical protein
MGPSPYEVRQLAMQLRTQFGPLAQEDLAKYAEPQKSSRALGRGGR